MKDAFFCLTASRREDGECGLTVLAELASHPGRAAAGARGRVTGATILAAAGQAAVLPVGAGRAGWGERGWRGSAGCHSRCLEHLGAGTRRAFSPAALQQDSLWLQRMPVQPAGQSQAVSSALHVAPFWQSSQVRLQSGPNVCSRQTAMRGAAGEKPSPRLLRAASLGRETPRVQLRQS